MSTRRFLASARTSISDDAHIVGSSLRTDVARQNAGASQTEMKHVRLSVLVASTETEGLCVES